MQSERPQTKNESENPISGNVIYEVEVAIKHVFTQIKNSAYIAETKKGNDGNRRTKEDSVILSSLGSSVTSEVIRLKTMASQ